MGNFGLDWLSEEGIKIKIITSILVLRQVSIPVCIIQMQNTEI